MFFFCAQSMMVLCGGESIHKGSYTHIYDSLDTTLTEFSYISSQAQKWKDISAAWIRQLRS